MLKSSKLSYMAMVVALSGCAYSNDAIFPSLFGTDVQENIVEEHEAAAAGITLGTTDFKPVNISNVADTGTFVGKKVITFRNELNQLQTSIQKNNAQLQNLRKSVVENALQYHKTVGMMEAKLQVGTTPGNPRMFDLFNSAQNNIQTMSMNLLSLNQLSALVAADTANTDYLSESIRAAYSISGAVDEDHANLRTLENESNQTSVLMHSLLNELNGDVVRQQQYIDTANTNLAALNEAIKVGSFGVNNVNINARPVNRNLQSVALNKLSGAAEVNASVNARPLFAVNFANKNVDYHAGLKQAVETAIAKKNNVVFEVVANNPLKGTNAQEYATAIFQEIVGMGVSADRINIVSKTDVTATNPSVMVFVQ